MKANLGFDLPEDNELWHVYNNAELWHNVLWALREELRQLGKGYVEGVETPDEMLEHITTFFYDNLDGVEL